MKKTDPIFDKKPGLLKTPKKTVRRRFVAAWLSKKMNPRFFLFFFINIFFEKNIEKIFPIFLINLNKKYLKQNSSSHNQISVEIIF